MSPHSEPSVEDLRRESERTRASLTSTVDELREKVEDTATEWKNAVSPSHIKAEVKEYVRESGEHLSQSIRRRARENPLQAAAIGAGLAYPLWGLIRSVPAPLLMIGAGLWLTQQKRSGNGHGDGMFDHAKHKAADFTEEATHRASEAVSTVKASVHDAQSAISSRASAVADQVTRATHDARDAAAGLGHKIAETASSVTSVAKDKAAVAKETVYRAGATSRDSLMEFVDRNPLVVGGVGLAVGAFIAASLPTSETENRLFGEQSDHLKDARAKPRRKRIDQARDVAAGVISDVASAAGREGLNAEGVRQAVGSVADGAEGRGRSVGLTRPSVKQSTPTEIKPELRELRNHHERHLWIEIIPGPLRLGQPDRGFQGAGPRGRRQAEEQGVRRFEQRRENSEGTCLHDRQYRKGRGFGRNRQGQGRHERPERRWRRIISEASPRPRTARQASSTWMSRKRRTTSARPRDRSRPSPMPSACAMSANS